MHIVESSSMPAAGHCPASQNIDEKKVSNDTARNFCPNFPHLEKPIARKRQAEVKWLLEKVVEMWCAVYLWCIVWLRAEEEEPFQKKNQSSTSRNSVVDKRAYPSTFSERRPDAGRRTDKTRTSHAWQSVIRHQSSLLLISSISYLLLSSPPEHGESSGGG